MEPRFSKATATTHSAISMVSALATGKGATIGVDLPCRVTVSLSRLVKHSSPLEILVTSSSPDVHDLVRTCVIHALKRCRATLPRNITLEIKVDSQIPEAVGLKSSSAVSTAVAKCVLQLCNKANSKEILDVSCKASIASGASITGAYDDAGGCLLGGMVFANNPNFQIIKHSRAPKHIGNIVVILIPNEKKFTSAIDRKVFARFKRESDQAFDYALRGDISEAMLLNSMVQCSALGYSFRPIADALDAGATAAGISGKGPAIAALCRTSKAAREVERTWTKNFSGSSKILRTALVQPTATSI